MVYQIIGSTKGTSGIGHWKPNRPMNVKPKITGKEEVEGELQYVSEDGKHFQIEPFDRIWGKPVEKVEKKKRTRKTISQP